MAKEATIKENIATITANMTNLTGDITEIKEHLQKQNGSISDTIVKVAKSGEIAKSADKKSDNNRRYIDKLTIAVVAALITAGGSVVAVILL